MLEFFWQPHVSAAALVLRLGVAAIIVFHGSLKLAQDGGTTWHHELTETTQMAVAWAEVIGGCALAVGLLSRLAALGMIVIQAGAIYMVTGADFVRSELTWKGFNFARPGFEYNFSLIILCAAVVLLGSGIFSLDHLLFGRRGNTQST